MNRTFLFTLFSFAFGILLAACGASNAPTVSPTALAPTNAPLSTSSGQAQNNANAANCATKNHAPFDAFRSDAASKLTASTKPKFIEFYAEW